MKDNPFGSLISVIRNTGAIDNPVVYHVGEVKSITQLPNKRIPVVVEEAGEHTHTHKAYWEKKQSDLKTIKIMTESIELVYKDLRINKKIEYVETGDKVLLIPSKDGQQFFLIARIGGV